MITSLHHYIVQEEFGMVRTQIQLDPVKYEMVKRKAHSENRSMSAVIRDAVDAYLEMPEKPKRRLTIEDFSSVGAGSTEHPPGRPFSVYHDDYVWEEDWRD